MPVTATWAIPYPTTATDAFCLGNSQTASIAQRLDTILNSFDVDLDRIQVVPYACIENDTSQSMSLYSPVVVSKGIFFELTYVQVNADTGNFTNLSANPMNIAISPPTAATGGIFLGGMFMSSFDTYAVDTAQMSNLFYTQGSLSQGYSNSTDGWTDKTSPGAGLAVYSTATNMFYVNATTGGVALYGEAIGLNSSSTADKITVPTTRMYFFWVADQ